LNAFGRSWPQRETLTSSGCHAMFGSRPFYGLSMHVLRTPDEAFVSITDYPFAPNYVVVETDGDAPVRIHYVDEGSGPPVVLMHGEPSWSYLYRNVIPILVDAGYRVLAPDLVGFGKSDKPSETSDYTYARHVAWMQAWLNAVDVSDITLFVQDWGGLIGLRMVAADPDRFSAVVTANTALPTGDQQMPEAFLQWREFSLSSPTFDVGRVIDGGTATELGPEVAAGYEAPFPDDTFKAGARIFPALVPAEPDDPEAGAQRLAWQVLMQWHKPWLTAFSDLDAITRGGDVVFQKLIPGAEGMPHRTIEGGGHFLQEDRPEEVAQSVIDVHTLVVS
jgi:haloalkane dehalogenase